MNHPDEGTIHAWLDGALGAAESRDIEAHIATCATCSAAVAEARGLIAASSRILGALDDVPGGVIPKPAAAPAAIVAGGASTKPRARRVWRAAPWVTGIAAVLVAAVVLRTSDMASERAMSAVDQELQTTAAPAADSQQDLSAVNATASVANSQPVREQTAARDMAGGAGSGAVRAEAATTGAPSPARAASAERQSFSAAPPPAAAPVAQRSVDAQAKALASAESRAASDSIVGNVAGVTAGARGAAKTPEVFARRTAQERQQTIVTSIPAQITGIAAPGTLESLSGCYRLTDATRPADLSPERAEVGRAATSAARRRAPAAAPSPAPAAGAARGELADAQPLTVIRLDTARVSAGHAVIGVLNDTVGSWRQVGDSARVDLGARGVMIVEVSGKVACPER